MWNRLPEEIAVFEGGPLDVGKSNDLRYLQAYLRECNISGHGVGTNPNGVCSPSPAPSSSSEHSVSYPRDISCPKVAVKMGLSQLRSHKGPSSTIGCMLSINGMTFGGLALTSFVLSDAKLIELAGTGYLSMVGRASALVVGIRDL